jgi:outer membrane receptor protein involved in Fe transport
MQSLTDLRSYLAASSGILGVFLLAAAGPVHAQSAPAESSQTPETAPTPEEEAGADIVVTGSRIDSASFESPTPMLRVTADDLSIGGRSNVGAAIADLPQFKAGQSPQTSGTNAQAGRMPADLRGLGANRTLVLLDGRRFSSDNDLNAIPTVLVKSVDIVTGGASAAWGSGAVAGVVNISLDGAFTGFKLGAQAGISSYGDVAEQRFEAAAGFKFADDRAHFVIGGEYYQNEGITPKTSRPNTGRWVTLPNGDGTFRLQSDVGYANAFYGGIITSGALRGQGFNPDGSLRTPDLGVTIGTSMIGGEAPSDDDLSPLSPPQHRYAGLARFTYEVSDGLKITADIRHSRYFDRYVWFGDHSRNLTIGIDNAFLRPEIRSQLVAAGQTSFTMGRFNSDLSYSSIDLERVSTQGTLAIDGSFGNGNWRYSAYYSRGESQNNIDTPGFLLTANYANAVDSIVSPTTGLPICRIALTDPATNCVPINLFGLGAPSQAAIDYVTGTPTSRSTTKLDTAGVSLRGEPFELWAGPVSVAVGAEWRKESVDSRAGALDNAKAFTTFSFANLAGEDTVKEAFAEIAIPLVKDVPFLRNLAINGAARVSDYRTTGSIWSWKLGATNEFFPGISGRITRSRDIRSASLSELFAQLTTSYVTINDSRPPLNDQTNTSPQVLTNGGGNPDLSPEKADTLTAGLVFAPVPRLNISVDYFNIDIGNVITAISAQDLVNRCNNGSLDLCARVFRDANGTVVRTLSTSVNLARYKTDGIDAELSYSLPLSEISPSAPGRLNFRMVGTWVNSLTTDDGVSKVEYVRSQGYAFVNGTPKWRVNATIGYTDKVFGADLRARYISPGLYNGTVKLTNNHIPAYTYFDLQLNARIPTANGPQLEVYTNISNMFDKDPPIGSLFSPYYDVVGRYISVGARIRL